MAASIEFGSLVSVWTLVVKWWPPTLSFTVEEKWTCSRPFQLLRHGVDCFLLLAKSFSFSHEDLACLLEVLFSVFQALVFTPEISITHIFLYQTNDTRTEISEMKNSLGHVSHDVISESAIDSEAYLFNQRPQKFRLKLKWSSNFMAYLIGAGLPLAIFRNGKKCGTSLLFPKFPGFRSLINWNLNVNNKRCLSQLVCWFWRKLKHFLASISLIFEELYFPIFFRSMEAKYTLNSKLPVFTWIHKNSNYKTIDPLDILLQWCIRAAEN